MTVDAPPQTSRAPEAFESPAPVETPNLHSETEMEKSPAPAAPLPEPAYYAPETKPSRQLRGHSAPPITEQPSEQHSGASKHETVHFNASQTHLEPSPRLTSISLRREISIHSVSSAPAPSTSSAIRPSSGSRSRRESRNLSSSAIASPILNSAASLTDIKSIAGTSLISHEDEALSLKVRSLYDSGVGGVGSDAGSAFSVEGRKRVSSILEENSRRNSRGLRNSLVIANGGSVPEDDTCSIGGGGGVRSSIAGSSRMEGRDSGVGARGSVVIEGAVIGSENEGGEIMEDGEGGENAEVVGKNQFVAGGTEDWEDLNGAEVDRYGFINPVYKPTNPNDPHAAPQKPFPGPKRVSTALHLHSSTPRKKTDNLNLRFSPFSPAAPEMLRSPLPEHINLLKEKENTRSKKWRDMAILVDDDGGGGWGGGGGGQWRFDTSDRKLVRRTWKGVPDCWRAAAWHAFLTASMEKRGIGEEDVVLIAIYQELTERPSADDVQIDLDVPRTINSHIMFRRRYRGGQRLLFRVLHALSLYFPSVGYVQGMATLAATLLCYYEEETAFVMLVRIFQLRGLEKLYCAGFDGLMEALGEFEGGWIKGGQVSRKLLNLGIGPTAYGTRWYLTLFNYSIPFPAQLRVWDVFMLLGDPDPTYTGPGFGGTLDVLHATSAALIDGMKGIILKSDFEGAMKVMTSWIPIKDEELLMKVARSEWKGRRRKSAGGFFHTHHLHSAAISIQGREGSI